jgi:hypothetical protein
METLFAVAWLIKVCLGSKCVVYPAPGLYACQVRVGDMVALAPESWKLKAECLTVRGGIAGA